MTATIPKLFFILDEEFELDQLRDIVNHGMSQGVPGFTYSSEIRDKWDEREGWIISYLNEWCEDNFNQGMFDYIAEQLSFDDKFWTMQDLIEYAVWMYVECKAHDILSAYDSSY